MNKPAQFVVVGVAGVVLIGGAVYLGTRSMQRPKGPGHREDNLARAGVQETTEQRLERLRTSAESVPTYIGWQAYVNALIGEEMYDEALAACDQIQQNPYLRLDSHALRASVHAQRGDADAALAELEEAYLSGKGMANTGLLEGNAMLAPLAEDPRFADLRETAREARVRLYTETNSAIEEAHQAAEDGTQ